MHVGIPVFDLKQYKFCVIGNPSSMKVLYLLHI